MKVPGDAAWVWWRLMTIMMMVGKLSLAREEVDLDVGEKLGYNTVATFDISSGNTGYSTFLTTYRNGVAAATKACDLQSTSNTENYVYVELKLSATEWVTVGIDAKDLYVWGYEDNKMYGKKYRARFFKDVPTTAYQKLFPDSNKQKTELESNYNKLVPRTSFNRNKLELKMKTIEDAVRGVYGKTEAELKKGTAEANFFFIMAQTVSEAARFKFMENAIVEYKTGTKEMSAKMIDFQSNWDGISSAIHTAATAKPPCQKFATVLKVGSFTYESVGQIKGEMGILKYKKNKFMYHKIQEDVLLEFALIM